MYVEAEKSIANNIIASARFCCTSVKCRWYMPLIVKHFSLKTKWKADEIFFTLPSYISSLLQALLLIFPRACSVYTGKSFEFFQMKF